MGSLDRGRRRHRRRTAISSQLSVSISPAGYEAGRGSQCCAIPMRWGYPKRGNWRAPDPIHARAETIDSKPTFAPAFQTGQRGIVLVKTFNEGKQVSPKVTEQYTIQLGDEPAGAIAFLFDQFSIPDLAQPLHPSALGQGARECWKEIWHLIGPQIDYVMAGKGSTWDEDRLVPVTRHGSRQDVWWTYSFSPTTSTALWAAS
jgi:hypothetical protein